MNSTCESIRDDLLVADLNELRGEGSSTVAGHVRSCAACRELAAGIIADHELLATSLGKLRASTPVTSLPQRRLQRAAWWSVPLAAAAALTLLLVGQQPEELPNMAPLARLMFRNPPVVTPASGQQAMVLEKNEMTIVWLYPEESL